MSRFRLTQLVTQLSAHPGLGPLASTLLKHSLEAWRAGDVVFPRPGSPTLGAVQPPADAGQVVDDVDLSEVYRRGAMSSEELDTLTVLVMLGASAAWPNPPSSGADLAQCLLWLETYTGLRCLSASSTVFDGARQRQLGDAILGLLTSGSGETREARRPRLSVAELAVGRSWLASSDVPECADLVRRAREMPSVPPAPLSRGDVDQPISGDLGPRPRHPVTLVLFAITGILFLLRAGRALGRWVLRVRTPTSLWISDRGLELFSRHEVLGRVLREQRVVVPIEDIRSVEREVRFPRFGLYAGLLALALGTLLGTRLFVDGLRVAGLSFPLIAIGLVCIVLGVALDMALSGLSDSVRGRCRLLVQPRRGRGWAVGDLDASGVDRLLTELSTQLASRR